MQVPVLRRVLSLCVGVMRRPSEMLEMVAGGLTDLSHPGLSDTICQDVTLTPAVSSHPGRVLSCPLAVSSIPSFLV